MKSICHEVRRNSPSVTLCSPASRFSSITSRIASSSRSRSASDSISPALYAARARARSGGRRRLPTWSARNGGLSRAGILASSVGDLVLSINDTRAFELAVLGPVVGSKRGRQVPIRAVGARLAGADSGRAGGTAAAGHVNARDSPARPRDGSLVRDRGDLGRRVRVRERGISAGAGSADRPLRTVARDGADGAGASRGTGGIRTGGVGRRERSGGRAARGARGRADAAGVADGAGADARRVQGPARARDGLRARLRGPGGGLGDRPADRRARGRIHLSGGRGDR